MRTEPSAPLFPRQDRDDSLRHRAALFTPYRRVEVPGDDAAAVTSAPPIGGPPPGAAPPPLATTRRSSAATTPGRRRFPRAVRARFGAPDPVVGVVKGAIKPAGEYRLMRVLPAALSLAVLNVLAVAPTLAQGRPVASNPLVVTMAVPLVVLLTVGVLASTLLALGDFVRRGRGIYRAVGGYLVPVSRFRIQLVPEGTADCVLLGVPGRDSMREGDTVRLAGRRNRRGPLRARRAEVLAGPTGPVVRVVEGRLPLSARVAQLTQRLGLMTCFVLAGTLVDQLWLLRR